MVDLGVSRNPEPPTAKDGRSISISRMREPRDKPVEGLSAARRYESKPVAANRVCDSRIAHNDARFGDRLLFSTPIGILITRVRVAAPKAPRVPRLLREASCMSALGEEGMSRV